MYHNLLHSNEIVPMEENSLFENLSFNPFNFEYILLSNNQDPDENLTESFNNCSYFTPDELNHSIEKSPLKRFSIVNFNIRNMKRNFEEFKNFINSLHHEFSIILLTETWCHDAPRNETLFKLENYTSLHQARNDDRIGDGTCFFIHNSLIFNKRSDLCINNNDIESLLIEITNTNSKNIIVNVTYRQPAGNIKVFEDSLKRILAPTPNMNKHFYITDDFNLNLLDYKTNTKVKSYLNMIFAHSFIPLINKPTRISRNNATLIDHILTNTFMSEKYLTGIIKTDISDHFPVFFVTDTEINKTTFRFQTRD